MERRGNGRRIDARKCLIGFQEENVFLGSATKNKCTLTRLIFVEYLDFSYYKETNKETSILQK